MSDLKPQNNASSNSAEVVLDSMTADYKVIFEFVKSEPVKIENTEFHKHEGYLHNPEKKYPSDADMYLREPMPAGFYSLSSEVYLQKGKMQFRKIFVALPDSAVSISRTGLATRKAGV